MKSAYIAGILALSLGFSAQAFAKDINSIDILDGNFSAIGTVDLDKLIANKMIDEVIKGQEGTFEKDMAFLKEAGINYKKDIDMITFAVTDDGHGCIVADANKDITESLDKLIMSNSSNVVKSEYNGVALYTDSDASYALLSARRVIACDNKIDIKPSIDNAKSDKPKTLKARNSTLNGMYALTSSSADIRIAGNMSKKLRKQVASYKLDAMEGEGALKVEDINNAALSIGFSKGLEIKAVARMKSNDVAVAGAGILNAYASTFLAAPELKEMGLDFLAKSVSVSSEKADIKGSIILNNDQLNALIALGLTAMSGAAK
jgi:hypothetical protein